MSEDDTLPTAPAPEGAPAESETSEATTEAKAEETAKTEADTDSEATTGEDGDEQDSDDDRPKKPSRYQRLKRERDALAAEIEAIRTRPAAAAVDDPAALEKLVKAEIGDPPKEADFDDWFAFERALTAYETEKRMVSRDIRKQASQAKDNEARQTKALFLDFQDRQREARQHIADFDKIVGSAENLHATPVVQQLILESEKGAVIQYHLAKNPAELERLNGLSPLTVAKEIARLEDRLSLPNPKKATSAVPPLKSPKGGAAATPDPAKMSMAEYVAWRKKGAA